MSGGGDQIRNTIAQGGRGENLQVVSRQPIRNETAGHVIPGGQ